MSGLTMLLREPGWDQTIVNIFIFLQSILAKRKHHRRRAQPVMDLHLRLTTQFRRSGPNLFPCSELWFSLKLRSAKLSFETGNSLWFSQSFVLPNCHVMLRHINLSTYSSIALVHRVPIMRL